MPQELYEHVFSVERRQRAATDMSLRCAAAPRAPLISSATRLVERNVRVMNFSCLFRLGVRSMFNEADEVLFLNQ